jgi:sugar lactone lactonase YvrE
MDHQEDLESHVVVVQPDGALQTWEPLGPKAYLTSIAADENNVYVADMGNRIVLRYNREGELLNRIGQKDLDRDVPGLVAPSPYLDLGLDEEGNLWVVNPGRLGIERYREDGDIVTSWYNPSMKLEGFSGCCNPSHIAFTKEGKLITAEKGLVRLKIYDVTTGEFEELVAGTELFPKEQSVHDLAVDVNNRILVLDPRHNAVRIFERTEKSNEDASQPA